MASNSLHLPSSGAVVEGNPPTAAPDDGPAAVDGSISLTFSLCFRVFDWPDEDRERPTKIVALIDGAARPIRRYYSSCNACVFHSG